MLTRNRSSGHQQPLLQPHRTNSVRLLARKAEKWLPQRLRYGFKVQSPTPFWWSSRNRCSRPMGQYHRVKSTPTRLDRWLSVLLVTPLIDVPWEWWNTPLHIDLLVFINQESLSHIRCHLVPRTRKRFQQCNCKSPNWLPYCRRYLLLEDLIRPRRHLLCSEARNFIFDPPPEQAIPLF
jgi:hypothetical protein